VLETLYRARWTALDGLGALVLSPTRELALQIFDELRRVGAFHDLSAGLLIGGKDVKEERAMVGRALPAHACLNRCAHTCRCSFRIHGLRSKSRSLWR